MAVLINSQQASHILSASTDEWMKVRPLLNKGFPKREADRLRKEQGLSPFKAGQYVYNETFFESRSLESAYWAGFIAADGYIIEGVGNRSDSLCIGLMQSDRRHLERIATSIGGAVYSRDRYDKRTNKTYYESSWRVSSQKLVDDLHDIYKIGPRKSETAEPPESLTKDQEYAFIAGLADGDAWYGYSSYKRPIFKLVGTKMMLDWVNNVLYDGYYTPRLNDRNRNQQLHALTAYGDKAIEGREKYIHMPLPFLERKYMCWEYNGVNLQRG